MTPHPFALAGKFCILLPERWEGTHRPSFYFRGCILHSGRVYEAVEDPNLQWAWAKVTHSQGRSKRLALPPTVAATVGEKTSQGQVVRCWGRQGGRGSGVTRPSWHQGGAFIPSPTGHQGSTNNWRLSKGVLRVARSLGVATASSAPSPG